MPDMVKRTISLRKDPSGDPATDLSQLGGANVDLQKKAKKVQLSLSKRGLDGVRFQVALFVDYSGSMSYHYRDGSVQKIVERALAFALNVDADGSIPVYGFDDTFFGPFDVTVENYQGVVERELMMKKKRFGGSEPRLMGRTVMSPVFEALYDLALKSEDPVIGIVVGDGSPNREDVQRTTAAAIKTATVPAWVKFLSVLPVDYLQTLDDLGPEVRPVDNFDTKPGEDDKPILEMSDLEFADAMTDELQKWISEATTAGILS
jgi:hypothetical protein